MRYSDNRIVYGRGSFDITDAAGFPVLLKVYILSNADASGGFPALLRMDQDGLGPVDEKKKKR